MNPPETVDEFQALPTIGSQLPLIVSPRVRWNKITVRCQKCLEVLPPDAVRGHIERPFGPTYLMEAYGLCACGMLSRYSYRFLPDGTIAGMKDGRWSVWKGRRVRRSWWRRLLSNFGLNSA